MSLTWQIPILRNNHPHSARFYMSVFVPTQVYCGTISGAPGIGDRTVTLVDVSGNIANLAEGMTLYVGTHEGDNSISKRRYRSRVGQDITVDENAISWAAGQFVTAYDNYELWPVYPYILPTSPFTFYKDRDVVYTDQNDHIPPVAIGGGPYVGFIDGGSKVFTIDASNSYAMAAGATITGYSWVCPHGIIAAPAAATTTLTFDTPHPNGVWLHLTVTDSNGSTQTLHIPVFVCGRLSNTPITDFSIKGDLTGDYKAGGYDMSVDMWDETVIDNIISGAYCVLWSENFFKGVEYYFAVNGNIRFAGYIVDEQIARSPKAGSVGFQLATIHGLMDKIGMTSVSLEEGAATNWYTFPVQSLTVARAVHHLWRWQSTLLSIADVFLPTSDTKTMAACDDFENGTLYSMVDGFTYTYSIFAKVCCDCAGRVHVEKDLNILPDADRGTTDIMMTLEDIDRRADTDVAFSRNSEKVSCVLLSGVAFAAGAYAAIMSACPGEIYADMGIDVNNVERLLLANQNEANFLSGRLFAVANQEVIEVNMALAGDYPIEIVPQVWWELHDIDTKRTVIDLENVKAVVRQVSYKIDLIAGTVYPILILEPEAIATIGDGQTVIPPVIDTDDVDPYDPKIPIGIEPTHYNTNWGISIILTGSGLIGYVEVPFTCTLSSVKLFASTVCDMVVDIWKVPYILFPPSDANSITGATPPTLSAAQKSYNNVLTGWVKTLNKGDILAINIDLNTGSVATLALSGVRLT